MLRLDNTKRDTFSTCPRKYYWNFVKNIRPSSGSCALRYGISFHAGMEEFYKTIREKGWSEIEEARNNAVKGAYAAWQKETKQFSFNEDDYRTFPALTTALMQYAEHFSEDEGFMEIVAPEKIFEVGMKSSYGEPFEFTGKIDLLVRTHGSLWIKEFKTTGWSLQLFLGRLHRSAQIIGYYFASTILYQERPTGVLVSVNQISSRKVKSGDWGKLTVDFGRIPQLFREDDVRSWRGHIEWIAEQIMACESHNFWPCNFDSCYKFGPCSFSSLCEQSSIIDEIIIDDRFKEVEPWDPRNKETTSE